MTRINTDTECFYTLRTCGALHEQLEFDFGSEFAKPVSETRGETTTNKILAEKPFTEAGSLKTGRANNES